MEIRCRSGTEFPCVRASGRGWNPAIYRFATSRTSPFTPLDRTRAGNDNLYYTGTAGHTFNPGSGLGTPNLAKLAAEGDAAKRSQE